MSSSSVNIETYLGKQNEELRKEVNQLKRFLHIIIKRHFNGLIEIPDIDMAYYSNIKTKNIVISSMRSERDLVTVIRATEIK